MKENDKLSEEELSEKEADLEDELVCPICGDDNIIREGRCITCLNCGWSKCEI